MPREIGNVGAGRALRSWEYRYARSPAFGVCDGSGREREVKASEQWLRDLLCVPTRPLKSLRSMLRLIYDRKIPGERRGRKSQFFTIQKTSSLPNLTIRFPYSPNWSLFKKFRLPKTARLKDPLKASMSDLHPIGHPSTSELRKTNSLHNKCLTIGS
jgi:hypothetical protein